MINYSFSDELLAALKAVESKSATIEQFKKYGVRLPDIKRSEAWQLPPTELSKAWQLGRVMMIQGI